MTDYSVRVGRSRRKHPTKSYKELLSLPYRDADDDGKQVECGLRPWPTNVVCPDCQKAAVVWAEACYVPGHRICPQCGSHWRLVLPEEREFFGAEPSKQWCLKRAQFVGG